MVYNLNVKSGKEKKIKRRKAWNTLKDQWSQVPNIGVLINMDLICIL
jgi:hypothetical protein